MTTTIRVEGIRVKATVIPKKKLISIWKMLTKKPFLKVRAFQLKDNDFDFIVERTKSRDDERREKEEWGRVLSPGGTDAFVVNADESVGVDYVIIIREKPYHSLEGILTHELSHVARGDL